LVPVVALSQVLMVLSFSLGQQGIALTLGLVVSGSLVLVPLAHHHEQES
jgi:hypothetical protein